jgi:hypothetical protein
VILCTFPFHDITLLAGMWGWVSFHFIFSTALLNPDLKETIECVKKIVKQKEGMRAW